MKTIIITGAASGIGAATAKILAADHNNIMLLDMNEQNLAKTVNELKEMGYSAAGCAADVTSLESMQNAVEKTCETFGRVDVLFNNAGIMPLSMLRDLRVNEWNAMIDVNIRGVLNGIAAVLPVMRDQKSGHIISTSSIAGLKTGKTSAVYSCTKFAVKVIMEGLRVEESADSNIRTTVIYPGNVNTNLAYTINVDSVRDFNVKALESAQTPENIARAVSYAISQPDGVSINEIVIRPTVMPF